MQKNVIFLLVGMVIGYLGKTWVDHPHNEAAVTEDTAEDISKTSQTSQNPEVTSDSENAATTSSPSTTKASPNEAAKDSRNSSSETTTAPAPAAPSSIHLNEVIVTNMENNWESLPEQAEAEIEEDGWRIHLLQPNSLFESAGFQDGDLIRRDSLTSIFQESEEKKQLAERLESVLNHITQ